MLQEPSRSEDTSAEPQVLPSLLLERYPHFALPELVLLKGPVAAFRLPEPEKQVDPGPREGYPPSAPQGSTSKHLRVSAMYALHLLGHHAYNEGSSVYTVNFDPRTQQVTAVPLRELLQAVFHAQPLHGAVYNVVPRKGLLMDTEKDFQAVTSDLREMRELGVQGSLRSAWIELTWPCSMDASTPARTAFSDLESTCDGLRLRGFSQKNLTLLP